MKTTKLIIAFFAIIFLSNLSTVAYPQTGGADNNAGLMVEKISKDIVLTNHQKKEITEKAKIFITKAEKANKLTDNEEKKLTRQRIGKEYRMALDSILTTEQKEQLMLKQNQRKEALIKRYQTQQ